MTNIGASNGLLRDYFPKGTDLSTHSMQHLLAVENELNKRPRIVLNDRTPAELFWALLASKNRLGALVLADDEIAFRKTEPWPGKVGCGLDRLA